MINRIKTILIMAVFLPMINCTDLDLNPESDAVPDVVFSDPDSYRSFIAKVYAGLSVTGQQGPAGSADIQGIDEGASSYMRMLFYSQEFPTETAQVGWNDASIQDFAFHRWGANDGFLLGLYSRLFYQVTIANEFLRETTQDKLNLRGNNSLTQAEVAEYRDEARFLRALSYWHALDLFRNVPFYTEADDLGADAPGQGTPQQVFDFIEQELLDIETTMMDAGQNEYARADKGAVWMLLAKLYLNAQVYTGQDRYADCLTYCEKIINSGAYQLADNYRHNFMADNHTSPEMIFPATFDGTRTQGFGGTTFMVFAFIGGDLMDPAAYGVNGGWGGVRTTRNMVELFPDASGTIDSRSIFFSEGQNLDVSVDGVGSFNNGYAIPKFTNIASDGSSGSNASHPDTDFPIFRYGDVLLMYAESVLRGGGGDMGTAVGYVNQLRERAYGNSVGNITEADLDLSFILDERGRELYLECHRRTDRIRFDQFTTNGAWQLKGESDNGVETPAFRNIYPIPAAELSANTKLVQNEGY